MKKITYWLSLSFILMFCQISLAQFSCDSPIVISDGYTAMGITTPGTGGVEDWNDPNPDSCSISNYYWDDDVYLFEYTAGATDEEISMTIFTRNSWNGIGIFSSCTGTALEGCLASSSTTTSDVSQTVVASVAAGETVYIAVGQWGTPNDLDFDVTAFNVASIVDPPSCVTFTNPTDGDVDVLEDVEIAWTQAVGAPTGYKISIGTSAGSDDVVSNLDLGNVLSYVPDPVLDYSTEYFVTVIAYNSNGDATGCDELSFTTRDMPPAGSVCGNPIEVTTPLPYVTTDDTSNYGDDYSGSAGTDCSSTSGYLNGDDVVYAYTPDTDTSIDIELSNLSGNYAGLFVYTSCADIGTQCVNGVTNGFSSSDMLIDNMSVTAGTTYYIVISTWASPQSVGYTLTISENTCIEPEVSFATVSDCENGEQFLVEVDLSDMGSATSITISDNQSSTPQTVTSTGVYTFGPFAHSTPVEVTVVNDEDANCTIVSSTLTEDYCLDYVVDCDEGPVNHTFCYFNNIDDDPSVATFTYTSTDGTPLNLTFNSGQMETCCDELVVIDSDGTELYNQNTPDPSGLTFQSSGDTISWYINSDGSVSCESSGYDPFDVTVACATCVNPVVLYDVVGDCANGEQFLVEVDLSDMGSATSITMSDNQGGASQTVTSTGVYTFGPYANSTPVEITVVNDDDANCTMVSDTLTQDFCMDYIVDCNEGPVNHTFCYFNNIDDDPSVATFTYTSTDGTPLNLTFNSGQMETCCDELVVIDSDGTELYNQNTPNPAGLTFQSSGDTISWYINSDFSGSCESSGYDPFDVTVSCATCINPEATYTVVDDCDNGDQFLVDVNIVSMGDATSLTISNNIDANTVSVTATGTYQVGPFPFLTDVIITTSNDQDSNCVINSAPIQLLACPPENDNPCNAIVAQVNEDTSCDLVTSGTIVEATPSGIPSGSCTGDPDDDVWFEFTAMNEVQIISLLNISGGTFNLDHAVYEGTCDNLTELYCSNSDASVTPQLVVGNTYYVRVFSWGSNSETSTFDLCIKEAPNNIICENSENFCAEPGGALTTGNIIGIPSSGSVACLYSIPNPTWNIIQIGEPGLIEIQIEQTDDNGNGLDVDFVLWGPFDSVEEACTDIVMEDCPECPNNTSNSSFYPYGNIVDCSYSINSVENLTIDNAQSGEIYILLVTNYSDDPGSISISQTNTGGENDGTVTAEIEVELGPDLSFCNADSYEIVADSPFADTYEWYANGFIIEGETGPTLTVTETNVYTVIAYDEQCDSQAQDSVTIVLGEPPLASFSTDGVYEVCPNATVPIEISLVPENFTAPEVEVEWYLDGGLIDGESGLTLPVLVAGEYTAEITNIETGCSNEVSATVTELESCVIPEGISPNGDGLNDVFDLSSHSVVRLEIYNRYGVLVYSKDNYIDEWHGQTNDGEELPVGTYFYTMVYEGGSKTRSAWVYLNR